LIGTLAGAALIALLVLMGLQAERAEPDRQIDLSGPLPGYPPCAPFVPKERVRGVEGLIVPRSAVLTRVRARGPAQKVQGYVPMTPVQLRRHYQSRPGITVLQIEDEIIEAEGLLTDGRFRSYFKAQAVCELGSRFFALVASEQAQAVLPTPAGSP
jgi:hypothetical protein